MYLVKQRGKKHLGGLGADDPWAAASDYNPWDAVTTIIDNIKAATTAVAATAVSAADGNLNLSASGGTSISAADFNPSTCKPYNFVALKYVQALQSQLNRVAAAKGFSKIGVDGQVGPGTLSLFKKVQGAFPSTVMGDASSCLNISADADVLSAQVQSVADTLGAPATVAAASSKAATIMTKTGTTVLPPGAPPASIAGAFSGISVTQGLALAAVGGLGYHLWSKRKKRK